MRDIQRKELVQSNVMIDFFLNKLLICVENKYVVLLTLFLILILFTLIRYSLLFLWNSASFIISAMTGLERWFIS